MTDQTAPHTLATHLVPLRRNWGWLMAAGVILIALGAFGLVATLLFSLVSLFTFGAMMLIGGGVILVDAFRREEWKSRILVIVIGALYILAGAAIFISPISALATLTLFVGAALIATGVLRIITAFHARPMPVWIWVLVSGLLSLLLGVMILVQWPASSAWVLGTFLAIELIFQGWAYVMLAQAIRSTFDGVRPKAT
ncbi:HdeD family acid-resistance protein [Terrarubrum flagellatum]|uniref:HdeD family acid-resistance protein n=1 Tax=Terrirubrum flagellatum TaxID=2895980 RepID=UPI003144FA14